MPSGLRVSREVLTRAVRRFLRGEWRMTLFGLAGPLAICCYTIFRPYNIRLGYHNLEQCAILLSGWYVLFAEFYALSLWTRPGAQKEGEDTRHLPLSQLHFFLQRCGELCLIPLRCLLLTLPLWFIVLLHAGLPYGEQWRREVWLLWGTPDVFSVWPARIAMATAVIATATLLSLALALVVSETFPQLFLRAALLLGPTVAMYFITRRLEYTYFRVCYRQTRGYDALSFLLPLFLWLALVFLCGMLRPRWRVALLGVALAGAMLFFVLPKLHRDAFTWAAPLRQVFNLHDSRMALTYAAGHLSPPKSLRLVIDETASVSNVLLAARDTPPEPDYDSYEDYADYQVAEDAWQKVYARLPRIPLWAGAVVYPLLLALLAFGGLFTGYALRRQPPREDSP